MPQVTFVSSDGLRKKTVDAKGGVSLADLCDDHEAPIPFSCRSASCATCHIEVLEGQEALAPPADEELDVLDAIQSPPPRNRLCCQAKLQPNATVNVVVRAQNEY
jgi:2Fe-2S ferredoxin